MDKERIKKEKRGKMAGTMIHLVIAVRLADFIEKNGYLIKTSIEEEEGTDLNRKNVCCW